MHPSFRGPLSQRTWERATGLAADVETYGKWVFEEARARIGSFYPTVSLPGGMQATVIAWLWARTVQCPNPLCGAQMPLIKSFTLSTKSGKEWSLEPIVDRERKTVRYDTQKGKSDRDGTMGRRGATCIICNEPVNISYIRSEGKANRIGQQMIAIVADGPSGRAYLGPNEEQVRVALGAEPRWTPDTEMAYNPRHMSPPLYGMTKHRDLFTQRQLLTLTTFSDLVRECRGRVLADAIAAQSPDDGVALESGGSAASAYADAVATYLGLAVGRLSDISNTLCCWEVTKTQVRHLFTRNAVSMVWDFAETGPFSGAAGDYSVSLGNLCRALRSASPFAEASVSQQDARHTWREAKNVVFSTDPPYYDNVPYADLSDFFYVWLRASLGFAYPDLLGPLLVPKAAELVADASRFSDSVAEAREFFEDGLSKAFGSIRGSARPEYPTTIYYAFKQSDDTEDVLSGDDARASAGWEAMLNALLRNRFEISGTWPIRSELSNRMRGQNSNALASSIVLSCRPRAEGAARCTRSELIRELRLQLPPAIRRLRDASLAATDLEQAAIGPGMAVFSNFSEVLEPDGSPMSVRSALGLINQELAQILLGEIADVDAETHFALAWFDGHFYDEARYGEAEVLLKAKNANLNLLRDAGVVRADRGVIQMVRPSDLDVSGMLSRDGRARDLPGWAQLMYLIASLTSEDGGTDRAAEVLRAIGANGAAQLKGMAYHCYLASDKAKRSAEAQGFNALVTAWPEVEKLAYERPAAPSEPRLL